MTGTTGTGERALELSEAERSVYRTMLSDPALSLRAVGKATGLSEARVRRSLDRLADLDLLSSATGSGSRRALPPQLGYAKVIADAEADLQAHQQQIDAARSALAVLAAEHSAMQERESIIRLTSLEAVHARLADLAEEVQVDCLSFNPGRAQPPDAMDASKPLNQKALERGVAIRCVYQDSFRNDPPTVAYADWLTGLGGEARTMPVVPHQMVIVDRTVALLPSDPQDHRAGAVEIRNPGMLAALCALFDHVWLTARAFDDPGRPEEGGLTPVEQELMRLLGAGHTDASAARKLDVSVRTVRRVVAELSERLGTRSRLELGAKASATGWL